MSAGGTCGRARPADLRRPEAAHHPMTPIVLAARRERNGAASRLRGAMDVLRSALAGSNLLVCIALALWLTWIVVIRPLVIGWGE